jgi:hypothetical protein
MPFDLVEEDSATNSAPYRRYATRYEPARRDACLAWWDLNRGDERVDDSQSTVQAPHRHFALLLDISHTGASVALDELPREDAGVWLRLEGDDVTEWTEAKIVGMTITNRGPHLIRLAFRAPCAFETLRAAVCG